MSIHEDQSDAGVFATSCPPGTTTAGPDVDSIAPGLPAHQPTPHRHRPARRTSGRASGRAPVRRSRRSRRWDSSSAFIAFPYADQTIVIIPGFFEPSASNFFLGLSLGVSVLCIGLGAIHWAKKLMVDEEIVEERHVARSSDADRAEFETILLDGVDESGIQDRSLIRRTLIGALLLLPVPIVLMLRDLGPLPKEKLRTTIIEPGVRIVTDGGQLPLRPEDIPVGGLVNAVPENLEEVEQNEGTLNARAKSTLMLIRLRPEEIISQQGEDWDVAGHLVLLEGLHPRRLPARSLRAAHPPHALPVPPVDLRPRRLRSR